MSTSLADFLNHGTLPFTGREAELDRLVEFWRGVFTATEMRALLLTGEAGVGKSRLLDELIGRIVDAGGSIVHLKFYPESTAPFLSLLARALWHHNAARWLLPEEPEATVAAIGSALQRLARLRPTILVFEDLHLLGAESLGEFTRLLASVADETISLLAMARPVELVARGALEPYLVQEMTLGGLPKEECARIWSEVSGVPTGEDVAATLHDATAGNPLALRSALRGALKGEDLSRPLQQSRWNTPESAASLARTLNRTVGLLADAMTAHLGPEELDAAQRLATLGEVFARESAAVMLDRREDLLDALVFSGVVSTAIAPPEPLPGAASAYPPLGFTHTLLHRQLIDAAGADADHLVRVLADGPLYSVTPFRLLSERDWGIPSLDNETIWRAFDRTIKTQLAIGRSAQWRSTDHTWGTAVRLVMSRMGSWTQEVWERMVVRLINHKLSRLWRQATPEREEWLDYLMRLTEEADTDALIEGRLHALKYRCQLLGPKEPELSMQIWQEVDRLIGTRDHIRWTFAYAEYLISACIVACGNEDYQMMDVVELQAEELLSSPSVPERIRQALQTKVLPPLLSNYSNQDELDLRLAHVERFENSVQRINSDVWKFCINLLGEVAKADALNRICELAIPVMHDQGATVPRAHAIAIQQQVLVGTGVPLQRSLETVDTAMNEIAQPRRAQVARSLIPPLLNTALLVDDVEMADEILRRYGVERHSLNPIRQVALALASAVPDEALMSLRTQGDLEDVSLLIEYLLDGGVDSDAQLTEELRTCPMLGITDLFRGRTIVDAIAYRKRRDRSYHPSRELQHIVSQTLERFLSWLAEPERRLHAYMRPILDRAERYFDPSTIKKWGDKIEELASANAPATPVGDYQRIKLSMLGTVDARLLNGESQRFQGARARMLLGTMVANRMLREPLSSSEFARIAAGGDAVDIENARDVVKTTVRRLRELIGRDAILTDGATPRLNPDLVDVDLLAAREALDQAQSALRSGLLVQAKGAMIDALRTVGSDVPFPSLYDEFIEAVRVDFTNDLRVTSVDIATMLLREGGADDAVEVLRLALEVISGDEGLAELLRVALLQSGQNAEAERVGQGLNL